MDGAGKRDDAEAGQGYTRRPGAHSAPASRAAGRAPALAAAALTFAAIAAGILHLQRPPAAPPAAAPPVATISAPVVAPAAAPALAPPAPPAAPAAGGSGVDSVKLIVHEIDPPAPAAAVVAPASVDAGKPRYLDEGMLHLEKPPEPEEERHPESVFIDYFSLRFDGVPVSGSEVAVLVDGAPGKVAIAPSTVPGMTKAVVRVPSDGRTHTVVFAPYYDLGSDGLVQVREIMTRTPRGEMTYVVETPVDRAVFRHGDNRRPIRLK